jgi:hypothetical protein
MKKLIVFLAPLALLACQLITAQIGASPTETVIPASPTATDVPTMALTDTPLPILTPTEKPLPTHTPRPTSTPVLPVAEVYGMPLNEAYKLLYAEGYSAEMGKDVSGSNTWGVYVYYWENTDYDQTLVCLWGGQLTTDPVDEVDLWRYTLTTVGTMDEKALKYYSDVLSVLGFTDVDIDGIVGKSRDLLTLAQQDRGEEINDELGGYLLTATLTTQVNDWGYTYGSFVIRIHER